MIQILTLLIMQLEDGNHGLLINFTECKIVIFYFFLWNPHSILWSAGLNEIPLSYVPLVNCHQGFLFGKTHHLYCFNAWMLHKTINSMASRKHFTVQSSISTPFDTAFNTFWMRSRWRIHEVTTFNGLASRYSSEAWWSSEMVGRDLEESERRGHRNFESLPCILVYILRNISTYYFQLRVKKALLFIII